MKSESLAPRQYKHHPSDRKFQPLHMQIAARAPLKELRTCDESVRTALPGTTMSKSGTTKSKDAHRRTRRKRLRRPDRRGRFDGAGRRPIHPTNAVMCREFPISRLPLIPDNLRYIAFFLPPRLFDWNKVIGPPMSFLEGLSHEVASTLSVVVAGSAATRPEFRWDGSAL